MLNQLIAFSIRRASFVVVIAVALVAYAVARLPKMPVDVFPELNAPTVVVLAESGGLAAEEVEQFVTFPVESAMNGLPGVRRVRSASAVSLALVWVEFDWGTDIHLARQWVGERLSAIRETLPDGVSPVMTPITSITGEIMLLAVSSPNGSVDDLEIRAWSEFELRNRLLAVPGVAQVSTIGGELPEFQVVVKQDRLALHGVGFAEVAEAVRGAHSTAIAGRLDDFEGAEIAIRQTARVRGVADIAATVVAIRGGQPLTVGDVADVRVGPAPKRGTASNDGRSSVVLTIQKSPGTNTLDVTARIDAALDGIEKAAPTGIVVNRNVFRQSHFIRRSMDNVTSVLRDATLIVAFVLVLFLLNVRTTIITLAALPLSLSAALLALDWIGLTLNVMTLGGLAVAIGELVDDAIIDVENVHRRLKENAELPESARRPFTTVVFDASNEIRGSVVYATVLICVVFVPLMFLGGVEGRFFKPLAITYVVSIGASLLVALTVTPAMCALLLRKTGRGENSSGASGEGAFVRKLKALYAPVLGFSMRNGKPILLFAVVATAASLFVARTFGTSFLPEFNEGSFTLFVSSPPGTSLAENNRAVLGIETRMLAIPGVASVTRRTGRAEKDEHAEPVSNSEVDVVLEDRADKSAIRAEIGRIAASLPGITVQIGQPIEHRLSHILSGTPAAIAVNIYGEDLSVLRTLAREVESVLEGTPGTTDVTANREVLVTSMPIRYRSADLAAAGLTPAAAAEQVEAALHGVVVGEVNTGSRRQDLVVRLDADERRTPDDVRRLVLHAPAAPGMRVRLEDVADVGLERTPHVIARENARRKAVVSCNVAEGANLGDLVASVRRAVEPVVHARGCTVEFGGQFEAQQSAVRTLVVAGAGIVVVMLLLLQLATGSFGVAMLVMANLPLAVIGGVAAVFVTDSVAHAGLIDNLAALLGMTKASYAAPVLSLASLVGFITLFGIAVRNGILLVNHYRHLLDVESATVEEAVRRGSMERLVPVLMTALSAVLGLLPLALAGGEPGSELLAPLAVVVLGGLFTSTFLNLIVVPAGYLMLRRRKGVPS